MDVLVGGIIIKGISGGERKRTSIAFELISDPQVIILD
jgi:ABC-type multidrug transport system ATPase subunit